MTEKEWLTSNDPVRLMYGLRDQVSRRKCELFELACAESLAADWPDPLCKEYHSFALRVVDGYDPAGDEFAQLSNAIEELTYSAWERSEAAFKERGQLDSTVLDAVRTHVALSFLSTLKLDLEWWRWIKSLQAVAAPSTPNGVFDSFRLGVYRVHLSHLRCIVGNPIRRVVLDQSLRTPTAIGLAEAIYADRAFDRLPILADALEDAGCDNADALAHCRGPGPHARGCWVVDLVLGKV